MGQDAFKKFINPKKNSVVKEEIRQDKKKARKEKREYFETKKAEEYKARQAKKGIKECPQSICGHFLYTIRYGNHRNNRRPDIRRHPARPCLLRNTPF